jgi:hypothetical protein
MIRENIRFAATIAAFFAGSVVATLPAQAGVINGGFETGTLSSWNSIGNASVVTSAFGEGPTGGVDQALVQGGSGDADPASALEDFLGVPEGSLALVDIGSNGEVSVAGGSAIEQTFSAKSGDTLTFTWNFITDEQPPSVFDDFAFWSLNSSVSVLATANDPGLVPFNFDLQTGFETASVIIPTAGTYTLALGVANVTDNGGSPQLLVDDVTLTSAPEPSYTVLLGVALAVCGMVRLRRERHNAG